MNPLTKLVQIVIVELGGTMRMFLTWFLNSELSAVDIYRESLVSGQRWVPKLVINIDD